MRDPEKQALRTRLMRVRAQLDEAQRREASAAAVQHLLASGWLEGRPKLALYVARPEEADPAALSAQAAWVAYPRVVGADLELAVSDGHDLVSAPPWGILEPPPSSPALALEQIDLWIVPGVGFGPGGSRIGYGRGYYDRTLARARQLRPQLRTIGFGFPCQRVSDIPMGPTDVPLDALVTADGLEVWSSG